MKYQSCEDFNEMKLRAERAESIVKGMFPMWIAAMSYCEHGRTADLVKMRNYYNGGDNPLTADEIRALLEIFYPSWPGIGH